MSLPLNIRRPGPMMGAFTNERGEHTSDELWPLEHEPVFKLGQAAKTEHVLSPGTIPVLQVDRGGQVTYHGPGQRVAYPLINLRRAGLGVRELVHGIEKVQLYGLAIRVNGIEARRVIASDDSAPIADVEFRN